KPYWQNIIAATQQYDPTFDATNWSGRVAGVKDFSAGKSSEMVRSANQTLHHVGQLLMSMDDLKNGDYPILNWAGNKTAEAKKSGSTRLVRWPQKNKDHLSKRKVRPFLNASMLGSKPITARARCRPAGQ